MAKTELVVAWLCPVCKRPWEYSEEARICCGPVYYEREPAYKCLECGSVYESNSVAVSCCPKLGGEE